MFKDLFKDLFSKGPNVMDLKVKLRLAERDRLRLSSELRKLDAHQTQLINDMKESRRNGNSLQVDYLYDELKQVKHDMSMTMRAARIANREAMFIKRAARAFELKEKSGDKSSIKALIEKLAKSGLDTMIANSNVTEEEYAARLDELLGTTEIETQGMYADEHDDEKKKLLSEIDAINKLEESGDFDKALQHERQVKRMLESERENR